METIAASRGPAGTPGVDQVEAVPVAAVEETPQNATHALVSGADGQGFGIVQDDDRANLEAFELKPHFASTFGESGRPVVSPMQAT